MNPYSLMKLDRVSLRNHPVLNERWVQARIAENPSILGIGDLALRQKERIQPKAGRLDLLLHDSEANRRYEVEIQLGETDESHIIRTVEYWDIERKRYPQYDHCAVIVAEHITARFLNVISLFNGTIPLIAIQMSAYVKGEEVALIFTTVLDELTRGLIDDEDPQPTTDRAFWEARASPATVALADDLLGLIRGFEKAADLSFKKHYVGLTISGQPNNFASFEPRKSHIILAIRLDQSDLLREEMQKADLGLMSYDKGFGKYKIRLEKSDIDTHRDLLTKLMKQAYDRSL